MMDKKGQRFCTECGSPVREGTRFCKKCGAEIEAPRQVAIQPVSPGEALVRQKPAGVEPGTEDEIKDRKSRFLLITSIVAACLVLAAAGTIAAILILKTESCTVPDLEGMEVREAREILEANDLGIIEAYRDSNTYESGVVISQDPTPGSEVKEGSEVTITISTGTEQEEVAEQETENEAVDDDVMSTEAGRNAPFYTVVLASLDPRSGHTRAEAEDFADAARRSGLDAGVLDSTKFKSLRQPYWVVYSGIFKDPGGQSQAESHLEEVRAAGYSNAYVRYVAFEGPGETGPIIP